MDIGPSLAIQVRIAVLRGAQLEVAAPVHPFGDLAPSVNEERAKKLGEEADSDQKETQGN